MPDAPQNSTRPPQLAIALGGGGARAAYQVGVLLGISHRFPNLKPPLITGVSAGAINAAFLANHTGNFRQKCQDLAGLWHNLNFEDVFTIQSAKLMGRIFRVGMRLTVGLPPGVPKTNGMVDTTPLRAFLHRVMGTPDGMLRGITQNLASGDLAAVAITSLNYGTGETIVFAQGQEITGWERPMRRSMHVPLTVEHVMASAALPLLFPSVQIGDSWYGDGGIRLVAPLGPAVHLGAERLLVLSSHYEVPSSVKSLTGPPSPAVVLGALYDAIFLDQLDHDFLQMERLNNLIRELDGDSRQGIREIKTTIIRPRIDFAVMANRYERKLPGMFRYFMRRFGSGDTTQQDFISTVMFHHEFLAEFLDLGERDAEHYLDDFAALIEA